MHCEFRITKSEFKPESQSQHTSEHVHASVLCVIEESLGNVYICFESGNCFLYALLKRFRDPALHSEILQNEAAQTMRGWLLSCVSLQQL